MSKSVRVDIPESLILEKVASYRDEITEKVADAVLKRAKTTTQFDDDTGRLRKSGRKKPSRYDEGTVLVQFTDPKAHLIEHGHLMVKHDGTPARVGKHGEVMRHVPAYPFLGPAADEVEAELPAIIASVQAPVIKGGG